MIGSWFIRAHNRDGPLEKLEVANLGNRLGAAKENYTLEKIHTQSQPNGGQTTPGVKSAGVLLAAEFLNPNE